MNETIYSYVGGMFGTIDQADGEAERLPAYGEMTNLKFRSVQNYLEGRSAFMGWQGGTQVIVHKPNRFMVTNGAAPVNFLTGDPE